jgi:SAM-dependent methyltransferase
MSGFSRDWLALREPFDLAARSAGDAVLVPRGAGPDGVLRVVDLGCGTGASLRALAPRLGSAQHWLLLDHDPGLLDAVPRALQPWADAQRLQLTQHATHWQLAGPQGLWQVRLRPIDLATGLADLPWQAADLVTSSALLDLVSEDWLAALVGRCRAAHAAVCWSLSVDGRWHWHPSDPADASVQALFAAHQLRDKGFGPALGAAAPARAVALLQAFGYQTAQTPSDWRIDGRRGLRDQAMLRALVDGMAQAAQEQDLAHAATVQAWRGRRLDGVAHTQLTVGHQDVQAWCA